MTISMALIFPVNIFLCVMVVVRISQYLKKYKNLAKRIEKFDRDLYLQRYCDRFFKSPFHTRALFDDFMNPEDAPESIRSNFSSDFSSIKGSFYSSLKWFAASIIPTVAVNLFYPSM